MINIPVEVETITLYQEVKVATEKDLRVEYSYFIHLHISLRADVFAPVKWKKLAPLRAAEAYVICIITCKRGPFTDVFCSAPSQHNTVTCLVCYPHSPVHLLGAGVRHKVYKAVEVCSILCRAAAPEVLHHSPVSDAVRAADGGGDQRHKSQGGSSLFGPTINSQNILSFANVVLLSPCRNMSSSPTPKR